MGKDLKTKKKIFFSSLRPLRPLRPLRSLRSLCVSLRLKFLVLCNKVLRFFAANFLGTCCRYEAIFEPCPEKVNAARKLGIGSALSCGEKLFEGVNSNFRVGRGKRGQYGK